MGTYPHLLTRQALPGLPSRVIAIDSHPYLEPIHASPGRYRHTLRCCAGVVTDYVRGRAVRRGTFCARDVSGVLRLVRSALLAKGTTWLVAHNVSYDLTLAGVWQWVEDGDAELLAYVIDDPPTCLHLSVGGKRLVCVDLLNYWRADLHTICAATGYAPPESDPLTDSDQVAADAANCHALATASVVDELVALLADRLGGGWKSTAAGIAWSAYRARVWGDRLYVHASADTHLLEREAYYGGRVECWKPGRTRETIHVLDINNLYGWCMHHYPHPVQWLSNVRCTPARLRVMLGDGIGVIARVLLDGQICAYPLSSNAHTVYPGGRFWTTLCGPELAEGLREGCVQDVGDAATYRLAAPYDAYVEHWYSARMDAKEQGSKAQAALAKLITSTLFGRLAMRGRGWEPYEGAPPPERYCVWHERDPETGLYHTCRAVAGLAQREQDHGEWAHSCVYASAYITSYARVRMRELRQLAGPASVYYEDTDCLHVDQAGCDRLRMAGEIHPTRLGALKLVEVSHGAMYWGVKAYQLDSGQVCAGLRPDAQAIADGMWLQVHREGICQVPSTGPKVWVDTQLVGYRAGGVHPAARSSASIQAGSP